MFFSISVRGASVIAEKSSESMCWTRGCWFRGTGTSSSQNRKMEVQSLCVSVLQSERSRCALTRHFGKSLVLHPAIISHGSATERIGKGRILSYINNTMRCIISSKTLCRVAKTETAQSLSPHSRCPTEAHDGGVFAQCWFAPQARQTERLLAGC